MVTKSAGLKDARIKGQKILDSVVQTAPSAVFISLSTVDGNSFAHAGTRDNIVPQRIAAMTSSLLSLSEALSKEVQQGNCSYNAIATDFGSIVTVRVPTRSKTYALSLCADTSDNMAMVMRLAFDTADKLAGALEGKA